MSPHLFAVYMDDLIVKLLSLKNGCHIDELFLACIVYADDLCLLAPCRSALQLLLDTCESYAREWCLSYNPAKSIVLTFGSNAFDVSFFMYGKRLDTAKEYKYLGVCVVAGASFSTSNLRSLIRFRSSANSILNVTRKPSEPLLMKLLYTICVPHLTYASDALKFTARQTQPMTVALNDCIRKIFGYHRKCPVP